MSHYSTIEQKAAISLGSIRRFHRLAGETERASEMRAAIFESAEQVSKVWIAKFAQIVSNRIPFHGNGVLSIKLCKYNRTVTVRFMSKPLEQNQNEKKKNSQVEL